jgi:hypothetical protein
MDPATRRLIESIHQAPFQCVLALTGGGTTAAAQLLEVPGGSRTVLEAVVPYGESALADYLGKRPEQFCSAQTSRDMARRAYQRACWLTAGVPVVSLGCTASLASDRPKRGDHRLFVSCYCSNHASTYSLTFAKGARDRQGEEAVLDRVILNALARAFQIEQSLDVALLDGEALELEERATNPGHDFFNGKIDGMYVTTDGQWQTLSRERKIGAVLPGSFNPVHDGHWQLAAAAETFLGTPVVFELSVDNADKPSLPEEEVRRRLALFAWRAPVVLTRTPIFADKARLFPAATFVVGADTALRIIAPRYYGSEAARAEAMQAIRSQGCRFLVAGRVDAGGQYVGLEDLDVPAEFAGLFTGIPVSAFRVDLSSTELRTPELGTTELRSKDRHAAQEQAE